MGGGEKKGEVGINLGGKKENERSMRERLLTGTEKRGASSARKEGEWLILLGGDGS